MFEGIEFKSVVVFTRPSNKKIKIDGVEFRSLRAAAKQLGINRTTFTRIVTQK